MPPAICSQLPSHKEIPADDSIMEYIHGEKGGAILIRQNLLPNDSEQNFCWFLWHELGHWYAINSEKDDLHRFNDPDLLDTITFADRLRGIDNTSLQLKQEGYWFWQEFIAEAISKYVSGKYDAERYTHKPNHIDWNPSVFLVPMCFRIFSSSPLPRPAHQLNQIGRTFRICMSRPGYPPAPLASPPLSL